MNVSHKIYAQTQDKFIVVIDPGHGGKDTGALGTGKKKIHEKDIVLSVGKKVAALLKQHDDIKVIMTRSTDKFLELRHRARIANKAKADVFVSIHCNSSTNPKARGSETFVLGVHRNKDNLEVAKRENSVILLEQDYELHYEGFDPNAPETFIGLELLQEEYLEQSILLASFVQREFVKRVKTKNRSVQQAGFAVLRLTYMPSVLTEIGFISNPAEEKFLQSEEGQQKVAVSIANAILDYKKVIEQNTLSAGRLTPETVDDLFDTNGETSGNATGKDEPVTSTDDAFYTVQIQSAGKKIDVRPSNFRNLDPVFYVKFKNVYKYFYGKTRSFDEARKLLRVARQKGYKDAFIVGFIEGRRVTIAELKKYLQRN
jgi:N-acetylmuramoyl-L-alanine amidase